MQRSASLAKGSAHDMREKYRAPRQTKKKFALLERFMCPCLDQGDALTNHGFSKSMIGTHDWICYLMIGPLVQINFARGGAKF